jgi:diguanylate cyclase (GGDEF)-like protein/PAS domain S-box-containing protein
MPRAESGVPGAPVGPPGGPSVPGQGGVPASAPGTTDPLQQAAVVPPQPEAPQESERWGREGTEPLPGAETGAGAGAGTIGAERRTGTGSRAEQGRVAFAALTALPKASTLVFDRELRYILAAGRAPGHHGLKPEELEGQFAEEVLGPDWWEIYGPLYQAALDGDARSLEIWSNDGTRCYLVEVGPLHDADQDIGGVAVFRDITKRKRADEARHEAEERFELVFEQGPVGMAMLTLEGRWTRVNQALVEITGYTSEALSTRSLQELTYPDDRSNDIDDLRELVAGELSDYRVEKRLYHARGHVISTVLWVSLVRDRAGKPQNLIAQIQDITERKLMEERLRGLAEHDPLTGLCNRRLFEHELGLQVDRTRRGGGGARRAGESSALLIVDLDNFRGVNESAGHRTGDELLKGVAMAMQERLRGTDLIARLDGDEFGVLLRGTPLNAAEAVAKGLRQVVADCGIEISGRQVSCTASIGITEIDSEVESDDAVRAEAERAMYEEKRGKRREYEDDVEELETDLPESLD